MTISIRRLDRSGDTALLTLDTSNAATTAEAEAFLAAQRQAGYLAYTRDSAGHGRVVTSVAEAESDIFLTPTPVGG